MPKRLLVLSYHFPPSGEVAGKVVARLLRHLGAHGWEAVVVAPQAEASLQLDSESYTDIERVVRVERTGVGLGAFDAAMKVKLLKNRVFGGPTSVAELAMRPATSDSSSDSWTRKLKRQLRELGTFPDNCSGWIGPAKRTALRLLKNERFDAMMSVSPSVSAHVAALKVHRACPMLPWIANFHDPWTRSGFCRPTLNSLRRLEQQLESSVVTGSDLIVCATEELREAFAEDHSSQQNYLCLYNGFDPADLSSPSVHPPGGRLIMSYVGSLYLNRDPRGLFSALRNLLNAGRIHRQHVLLRFIGDCERVGNNSLRELVANFGLEGIVEIIPPVTYPKALEYLGASHVLVLFAEGQPMQIPAKTFEYLFMNRRILAICDGATASLIHKTGGGDVVNSFDVTGMETVLERWASELKNGQLPHPVSTDVLDQFRADRLAAIFSQALGEVVARRNMTPMANNGDRV
jgi:glycosyltransferase involved in cell wall biosynthesis